MTRVCRAPVSVHETQDVACGKLSSCIHLARAAPLCAMYDGCARMLCQAHGSAVTHKFEAAVSHDTWAQSAI